jgi:hypothetical protein
MRMENIPTLFIIYALNGTFGEFVYTCPIQFVNLAFHSFDF